MDLDQQYRQPSKFNKSAIIFIIIAIIICGLIVFLFILSQKNDNDLTLLIQENKSKISKLENKIIVKSPTGEITAVIDTSNWQEYKNDELGFSLRIPQGITPQQENDTVIFCPGNDKASYSEIIGFSCLNIGISDEEDLIANQIELLNSPFILDDYKESPLIISGIEAKKSNFPALGNSIIFITLQYQQLNYFIMYPTAFSELILEKIFESMVLFEADRTKLFGKKRDARRISNIKQFQIALELRYIDQNNYPYCLDPDSCNPDKNELGFDLRSVNQSGFNGTGTTYMGLVPKDPLAEDADSSNDDCVISPAAGCKSVYRQLSKDSYAVDFFLETEIGGIRAGSNCATENGIIPGKCN